AVQTYKRCPVRPMNMRAFGPHQLFYNPDMATQARPATVRYFTPDLFRFLERLRRNNRREWFLKHKQEYERVVRDPCLSFIRDFANGSSRSARIWWRTCGRTAVRCSASTAIRASRLTSAPIRPMSEWTSDTAARRTST